jgi:hypothetical protein
MRTPCWVSFQWLNEQETPPSPSKVLMFIKDVEGFSVLQPVRGCKPIAVT